MRWFFLSDEAGVLELDSCPLELHVYRWRGQTRAAWLLDNGKVVRAWTLPIELKRASH